MNRWIMSALIPGFLVLGGCAENCCPAADSQTTAPVRPPVQSAEKTQPATAAPATADDASGKVEVKIDNFTFSPKSLSIARGTTVTWVNRDDVPHTVKSTEKKFKSGTLDTDDTYSFTFTEPGTYPYFCTVHPHMTGEIIVK